MNKICRSLNLPLVGKHSADRILDNVDNYPIKQQQITAPIRIISHEM